MEDVQQREDPVSTQIQLQSSRRPPSLECSHEIDRSFGPRCQTCITETTVNVQFSPFTKRSLEKLGTRIPATEVIRKVL